MTSNRKRPAREDALDRLLGAVDKRYRPRSVIEQLASTYPSEMLPILEQLSRRLDEHPDPSPGRAYAIAAEAETAALRALLAARIVEDGPVNAAGEPSPLLSTWATLGNQLHKYTVTLGLDAPEQPPIHVDELWQSLAAESAAESDDEPDDDTDTEPVEEAVTGEPATSDGEGADDE